MRQLAHRLRGEPGPVVLHREEHYDGLDAAAKIALYPYDVLVLDRDLPGMHGDACRLAADQEPPAMVLMLTAADSARERVAGLSVGADDYLTKAAP